MGPHVTVKNHGVVRTLKTKYWNGFLGQIGFDPKASKIGPPSGLITHAIRPGERTTVFTLSPFEPIIADKRRKAESILASL